MKKTTKIFLIIGIVLLCVGLIIFLTASAFVGFNYVDLNLSSVDYEFQSKTIDLPNTKDLTIDSKNATIEIKNSLDDKIHIEYHTADRYELEIESRDNTIYIDKFTAKNVSNWFSFSWFSFNNHDYDKEKIVIAIPKDYADNLTINLEGGTADVDSRSSFNLEDFTLNSTNAFNSDIQNITTKGDIHLNFENSSNTDILNLISTGTTNIKATNSHNVDVEYIKAGQDSVLDFGNATNLDIGQIDINANLTITADNSYNADLLNIVAAKNCTITTGNSSNFKSDYLEIGGDLTLSSKQSYNMKLSNTQVGGSYEVDLADATNFEIFNLTVGNNLNVLIENGYNNSFEHVTVKNTLKMEINNNSNFDFEDISADTLTTSILSGMGDFELVQANHIDITIDDSAKFAFKIIGSESTYNITADVYDCISSKYPRQNYNETNTLSLKIKATDSIFDIEFI